MILSKTLLLLLKKKAKPDSILYLAAFFPENAGYHWRVQKWSETLMEEGYNVEIVHALNKDEFYTLKENNFPLFLIRFLRRRFRQVVHSRNFETIIVRRELLLFNDYGNLFLEKLLLKIHPDAILDFDDDIAAAKGQPREIRYIYARLIRENGDKFNQSLRFYNRFIVASNYLKSQLLNLSPDLYHEAVLVMPTCVDYNKYPQKKYSLSDNKVSFGWIGGEHNYPLLESLLPILERVADTAEIELLVISGKPFKYEENLNVHFIPWSLETEVENLYQVDIGLMPLSQLDVDKGKSGFKLIQYMGLGIVSIASAITINKEIVNDKVNGFLVHDDDWEKVIRSVLWQKKNFEMIGSSAKATIDTQFTFQSNKSEYVKFVTNT